MGTVAYMSPEQAEGKKLDARSDIFSFGSVLYEMVTGRQAFKGDSKASTVAAILKEEPKPAGQFVEALPKELERVIVRCLRKDPERRIRDMGDVKLALEDLKEESDSGVLAGTVAPRSAFHARRIWVWGTATLLVVAIAVMGWLFRGGSKKPAAAPEVVPLTSYVGVELSPSFSPDGNQVAFSWNGEKQDNYDIYLKLIGSQNSVRLTTDPADDVSPAFSPDGRSIGFIRLSEGHAVFVVIPAIGGTERIVAEVPTPGTISSPRFAWFPSGNWVVTDGLALLSTETGETRSLTFPPMKSLPDFCPSVSPDGRTIAFGRATSLEFSDIYLLDLTEELKPKGEPKRLSSSRQGLSGSVWTSNGKEIIFSAGVFGSANLWRIPASGAGEPEQLAFAGEGAYYPAISRSGSRLAYERWNINANIWRLSQSAPG